MGRHHDNQVVTSDLKYAECVYYEGEDKEFVTWKLVDRHPMAGDKVWKKIQRPIDFCTAGLVGGDQEYAEKWNLEKFGVKSEEEWYNISNKEDYRMLQKEKDAFDAYYFNEMEELSQYV